MNSFTYDAIDLEGPSFRLLRLLRGEGPVIQCELFQAFLHQREHAISYEALSYAWGPKELSESIQINGQTLGITMNLFLALKHLRLKLQDRVLWVDAVCIDQSNLEERGHQVRQMSETYKQAHSVIFWLGEGTHQTNIVMDYLRKLQKESLKHVCKDWKLSDERWLGLWTAAGATLLLKYAASETQLSDGLRSLLDRPWFRRVWILQEVAKAHAAVVCCGTKSVKAAIFALAPRLMHVTPNHHCQSILDIMPGAARNDSWWGQSRQLHTLLGNFGDSEAHDPRDMIYALLGLSSDASDSADLLPDYSKSESEVVRSVVSFLHKSDASSAPTGQPSTIRCLLQQFKPSDEFTDKGRASLTWAAESGNGVVVRVLLDKGCDIESKDSMTALSYAVQHGREAVVQQLLKNRCITESKDFRGKTPLMWAARRGNIAIVQLLLEKGSNIEAKDKIGMTPLMWAVIGRSMDIIQLLLKKGSNMEARDHKGMTPLMWAARRGIIAIVRLLLKKGSNIEAEDHKGKTPRMWAVNGWIGDIIRDLIEEASARRRESGLR